MPIVDGKYQRPGGSRKKRKRPAGYTSSDSLGDVLYGKLTAPNQNKLEDILDTASFFPQGLAGMALEHERRHKGYEAKPYWTAFKGGAKKSSSFMQIEGMNPVVGLAVDILADPANLLGFGVVRGAIAKGLITTARVTRAERAAKSIYKATEASKYLRESKEGLAGLFRADHMMKKYNPAVVAIKEKWLNKIHKNQILGGHAIRKRLERLVPDYDARVKISDVLDIEPIDSVPQKNKAWQKWNKAHSELSENEKKAYGLARDYLDDLEKQKIKFAGLTEERARAFEMASGGKKHVPHRLVTSQSVKAGIDKVRKAYRAGDPEAIAEVQKNFPRGIEELDQMSKILDMPTYGKGVSHGANPHLRKRGIRETMKTADKEGLATFERDVGRIVETEAKIVGKQRARTEYMRGLTGHLTKNGLAVPPSIAKQGEGAILSWLAKTHGLDEAERIMRGGLTTVKGVKGIEGFKVPKAIAAEFDNLAKTWTSGANDNIKRLLHESVAWQKAWTLMPFPEYHIRNMVSNKWNMFLGGFSFTPKNVEHMRAAALYTKKWMHSGIPVKDGPKVMFGMSEKQLFEKLVEHRIYDVGEATTEIGMTMQKHTARNILTGLVDPRHNRNVITKTGYKAARLIENSDRMAGAFRVLANGGTMDDAAKWTHKYLFDYKNGLSVFEDEVLRKGGLMPFYAWTRFNLPLQAEALVRQPHKFTAVSKTIQGISREKGGPAPGIGESEWLQKATSVRIGYNAKTKEYEHFVLDSWIPMADLGRVMGTKEIAHLALGQINPVAKIYFENAFNYNLWRMSKIEKTPGEKEKFLRVDASKKMVHFLKMSRMLASMDKFDKAFNKGGALSAFRNSLGKVYKEDANVVRKRATREFKKRLRYAEYRRKIAIRDGDKANADHLTKVIKEWKQDAKELGFGK